MKSSPFLYIMLFYYRIISILVSSGIATVFFRQYDFEVDIVVTSACAGNGIIDEPQRVVYFEAQVDTFDVFHRAILFQLHTGAAQ